MTYTWRLLTGLVLIVGARGAEFGDSGNGEASVVSLRTIYNILFGLRAHLPPQTAGPYCAVCCFIPNLLERQRCKNRSCNNPNTPCLLQGTDNCMASTWTSREVYDILVRVLSSYPGFIRRPTDHCALCCLIPDPDKRQQCVDMYCNSGTSCDR
ncbi:uncharacterized protein LOC124274933 [Haliotis rubra]|uniref:uncharacterized protein LOC124274933 n=1 Tax=Haliotis rubra TaxID=36100 RepID=UPI001EE58B05|nr:uncharacterized protein LOC124274933 [Haliotis rubra]